MTSVSRKLKILLTLVFLFVLFSSLLFAQDNTSDNQPGDNLTLKIAIMGPGDELYFWWGHIGLLVEDNKTGQSWFYDWGVFSFENENFFVNFALGRLIYSCVASRSEPNINSYIKHNRDVTLYTLDLPADKKDAVMRLAETNMLPENRDYFYHHFRDNCATRIRDIIDIAVDGQFKAAYGDAPGRYTLRQHVRRHTWFSPFFDWVLNLWMGQDIDKPITVWDEMFLPSEIALRINEFSYVGSDGDDKPLVSTAEILNLSKNRPMVLETPRRQWPRELLVSILFSGAILLLYFQRGKLKKFRVIMGLIQSLLGLFFGIAGSMLLFMSFFTDHDYTYHNSNIFFVNPLFLALIPLGLLFAFSKNEKKYFVVTRLIRAFWAYVILGGLLAMAIKLFPAFYQQNQVDLALVMPIAFSLVFINIMLGKMKRA